MARTDVSLRVEVAADWLIRSLLPELLLMAGNIRCAYELGELSVITREVLASEYGLVHVKRHLAQAQSWLADAVIRERVYGREEHIELPGSGDVIALPHLTDLTRFVGGVALRTSSTGSLVRSSIELVVELLTLRGYNDKRAAEAEEQLRRTYARQFDQLLTSSATAPATAEPVTATPDDSGISVQAARQATSTRDAFVGVYTTDGESHECGHRHHERSTARSCARKLRAEIRRQSEMQAA